MTHHCRLAALASLITTLTGTPAMARWWTGPISEDSSAPSCSGSEVAQAAFCGGTYCHDNWLLCGTPNYSGLSKSSRIVWTPYTSDEDYNDPYKSLRGQCPFGYALVGMSATGSYSDNVRSLCQKMNLPTPPFPYAWATGFLPAISGPGQYSADVAPFFLTGFKCYGSYCGNMVYQAAYVYGIF